MEVGLDSLMHISLAFLRQATCDGTSRSTMMPHLIPSTWTLDSSFQAVLGRDSQPREMTLNVAGLRKDKASKTELHTSDRTCLLLLAAMTRSATTQPGGVYSMSPGPNVAENTGIRRAMSCTRSAESALTS